MREEGRKQGLYVAVAVLFFFFFFVMLEESVKEVGG